MNKEPDKYWKRAWRGPQAKLLWVAVLTAAAALVVLFVAALLQGLTAATFASSALGIGFTLLGIAASLALVGVIGWSLVRWLRSWRNLRRVLLVGGTVATLVALFYAEEDLRGRWVWSRFYQPWEARGERFDMASFIPPAIPDEQNFFMTPAWESLRFTSKPDGGVIWRHTNQQWNWIEIYGPKGGEAPLLGNSALQRRTKLDAWQAFYRGTNNQFAVASGFSGGSAGTGFTNYFPVAATVQTPADDVLLALSRFDAQRGLLIEAAARPGARFWINYENDFAALLPHLARAKQACLFAHLQTAAALEAGRTDLARENIALTLRMQAAVQDEPCVISQLVRTMMARITLDALWEGLLDHRWTESQLAEMQQQLGKIDFLAAYQLAMRGDRALCIAFAERIRRSRRFDEMSSLPWERRETEAQKCVRTAVFHAAPAGWFYQAQTHFARTLTEKYLPLADVKGHRVSPVATRMAEERVRNDDTWPGKLEWELIGPVTEGLDRRVISKFAAAQTHVELAGLACALERYWLAQGSYPSDLAALVPQYIATLPHDIINGEPLKYRQTDDGRFVLYSVGWNEKDDDGVAGLSREGDEPDIEIGDWVWRYTPAHATR